MTVQPTPRTSRLMTALVIVSLILVALLWAAAYIRSEPKVPRRTTIIRLDRSVSHRGLVRRFD
ncbi:MAG TPA: hypothetical protein VGL40_14945 [Bacillota bacterium]